MEKDERAQLRAASDEVSTWVAHARTALTARTQIGSDADHAIAALRNRVVDLWLDGRVAWQVLILGPRDSRLLRDIARQVAQPAIGSEEGRGLGELTGSAATAVEQVKALVGARRFFSGSQKRESAANAAEYLKSFHAAALRTGLPAYVDYLAQSAAARCPDVPVELALAAHVDLVRHLGDASSEPALVARSSVIDLAASIATLDYALNQESLLCDAARAAGERVRAMETRSLLSEMPADRLREATRDRIRVGPLLDAGITDVQAVLDRSAILEQLPGIGATTANRMRAAAQTMWHTTYGEMPVRIDINRRTGETTELLSQLRAWEPAHRVTGATGDVALRDTFAPLVAAMDRKATHLVVLPVERSVPSFHEAMDTLHRAAARAAAMGDDARFGDPWDSFAARPADFFALLAELGFLTEHEEKTHGDLPDEIVAAIRQTELDTQELTASLRGYQSFAARFVLCQRKVLIGDEMGLGKTLEGLAVFAHLHAKGERHGLVICPASVVTNWVREVNTKTRLRSHRIHGRGRHEALQNWRRHGGVAVTTFETLKWLAPQLPPISDLSCVIVDEAQYVKNPSAHRSRRVVELVQAAEYSVFLTGTPLENRVGEFGTLVGYLRPDLVVDADELAPRRFRTQVAPAYLRRNQEDVLSELPELVEVSEWLPLSDADLAAYRDAVYAGQFMAMRKAAMSNRSSSAKVQRLLEIVEEAEANSRKVIVFSYFRDVLDDIVALLPGEVFGPLSGSVRADERQTMVDEFSAAGHGAVLVSQVVAGGVGLNIQAASVIVMCEPQLKPTTEWQAIARAHRMGQLNSVQVHRLLTENSVDERITEILARKKELFDEFARISNTAESAPEALDVSEAELAREVVALERERLFAQASLEEPAGER
ncbi:DEAD/DEAH box helicase [Demequina sp. SYSU T00192]|uniref:DEAD/DEAH box helicase n=1 Tax=Demequina litoralis TaxID=3051660 RepID=A0ABT8G682_9MICO|nr:DEAD/DEAH box helicase [Demequina sp. SYSU T00192]MDN4474636.1 DEAD/DEAH box helicase [Demequina sp. SYSU T00192]